MAERPCRPVAAALPLLIAASAGCASLLPRLPPSFRPCREDALASPSDLGPDFRWRGVASLRARGEERAALELVVEKRGDRLVLVAFDRTGLKVLSAVQEGEALRAEPAPGRPRPVAAGTLLADLRRMRDPASVEDGVAVVRDETGSGEPRVTLRDARCGTESVYVTSEDRPLPDPAEAPPGP